MTENDRPSTHAEARAVALDGAFSHIQHPKKRAFLRRYAMTGRKLASAQEAGVHPDTVYSAAWRDDKEFQAALELARLMVGDVLEEAMIERGVQGVKRVRFHNKSGEPLRDPFTCECGQPRDEHTRTPEGAWGPHPDVDCAAFSPEVYTENEYSDRLLEQLARAHLPERYASSRLEVTGTLAGLDYSSLPDEVIHKIVLKVHPLQALVEYLEERGEEVAGLLREGRPAEGEIVQDDPEEVDEL